MASAVRRKFRGAELRRILQCRITPFASDPNRRIVAQFWHESIVHDGLCVVPENISPANTDPEVSTAVVMAQVDVDELLCFLK
jgi:hypothetical protein